MELPEWHMWWKRRGARELRRFLMEQWDPIGVRDAPEAADEYDSYLGRLAERLRAGAGRDEIASYLRSVRTEAMGIEDSPELDRQEPEIAARICDWYREVAS